MIRDGAGKEFQTIGFCIEAEKYLEMWDCLYLNLHIDRKFEDWSIKSIEAIDTSISSDKLEYI